MIVALPGGAARRHASRHPRSRFIHLARLTEIGRRARFVIGRQAGSTPVAFKILLVEDVKTIRTMILLQLGELGIDQVAVAVDGTEALSTLARDPDIDLILSDWHMEPMDGLDFCARIQALPRLRGRRIPVVFMTNDERLADPAKRTRALETARGIGIVDILMKPFSTEDLRAVLARCGGVDASALSAA